jgi:hypothetical protein
MPRQGSLHNWLKSTQSWLLIGLISIFLLATAVRLIDLTDPPLDYFPQRQLRAAIIARGIYYQLLPSADPALRAQATYLANTMDPREPSVFEGLVALTYLAIGAEHLWVARVYAILFWWPFSCLPGASPPHWQPLPP